MMMLKKLIKLALPKSWVKQILSFYTIAKDYGQYKSIKNNQCVDSNGDEIPWYTYPAIEYLNNIDFTEKSVFEFGSGNSSIYWANKAKKVISVEHDINWYKKCEVNVLKNQTLLLRNDSNYEKAISESGMLFDVIIIDGIRRSECTYASVEFLNKKSDEGFMIILDNSDLNKDIAKFLRKKMDLIEVDFHGFGPINSHTWTTSIFLSRNYNFRDKKEVQPNFSIGAKVFS